MNTVSCCTALDLLTGLDDFAIGAIVTDPPERVDHMRQTIREMGRVVRPGGGLVLIGSHQSLRGWDRLAPRAEFDYIADLVVLWDTRKKESITLGSAHSRVVWYTRKGLRQYTTLSPAYVHTLPSNVLVCKRVPLEDRVHPTEKPVGLSNFLVSLLTNHSDVVADTYCGSGSTLVSAVQCERTYIGCDTNPEYVKTAERRIMYAEVEYPAPVFLWVNGVQHEV